MSQAPRLQDLSRADALLCLEVEKFCLGSLGLARGSRLVLTVSGGADSCSLALIMAVLAPRNRYALSAVHVNHQLRPAADEDASFVAGFCASLDIPCAMRRVDVAALARSKSCGLEEAGRAARYRIFAQISRKLGGAPVLLAHHAQDLLEDIFMRLLRGAGWPALAGMTARAGLVVRPLLRQSPARLRNLLMRCGLAWREDESNQDRAFLRNRIRHDLLPLLGRENPGLARSAVTLNDLGQLDADFWNSHLDALLESHPPVIAPGSVFLPASLLQAAHRAARLRLYMRALGILFSPVLGPAPARATTLLALDEKWALRHFPAICQLPGHCQARVDRSGMVFELTSDTSEA